ncbi:MAG: hypothetical protein AAFQ43_14985 [Bacteroidota bacterium]
MSRIRWGIWTDTPDEAKSRRVIAEVLSRLGESATDVEVTAYPKTGGHRAYLSTPSRGETWAERVLGAVQAGLRVGRGWLLTGDGEHDLSGWSNEPAVPGVVSISWDIERTHLPE